MAEGHEHDHGDQCEEALAELYTFLDGELTDERRTLISRHLDDCNPCLEIYDFEAELRMVISHRCRDEVPESLRERIATQLEAMMELADPASIGGSGTDVEAQGSPEPAG